MDAKSIPCIHGGKYCTQQDSHPYNCAIPFKVVSSLFNNSWRRNFFTRQREEGASVLHVWLCGAVCWAGHAKEEPEQRGSAAGSTGMQGARAAASPLPGLTHGCSNVAGRKLWKVLSQLFWKGCFWEKKSLRLLMAITNSKSFSTVTVVGIFGCLTCTSVHFFPKDTKRHVCLGFFFSKSSTCFFIFNAALSFRCLIAVKLPAQILACGTVWSGRGVLAYNLLWQVLC